MERNIAFLEAKRKEGDEELFASAVRIVFPSDKVLSEMEDYSAQLARDLVHRQNAVKPATDNLENLQKQRLDLEKEIATLEVAVKPATGVLDPSIPQVLNSKRPTLGRVLDSIERAKATIQEVSKVESRLGKAEARVKARREELVRTARLRIELAKAVADQSTLEAQTSVVLGQIAKETNSDARSALIRISFQDRKLDDLVAGLRSADINVDEAQAGENRDLSGKIGLQDHARKLLLAREQELVRTARLLLELSRNKGEGAVR